MLDVRRLRVLREVAVRGSFSAAAESLSFTQSAVSQQIAALEREAGAKLVERGARGIRLTPAGQALVSHADAILSRLDDAELDQAHELLRAGEIDVALVMDFPGQPLVFADLETEYLLDDAYFVALPDSHRLAGERHVALSDLSDEDWINSCP